MKTIPMDDINIGQAVTILHGPYETVMMPPMMLNGEDPPTIDTATPGRVFIIEAVDMNTKLIMLKALDGGGPPQQKMQQVGSLMALFPEQSKPDTYIYELNKIELAVVSPEWLKAYTRNFCAHKRGTTELRERPRKPRPAIADEMAIRDRPAS